jgi:hypothetical protein
LFPNIKSLDGYSIGFEVFMDLKIYVAINQVKDGRHHIGSDNMYDHPRRHKRRE